MEIDFLIETRAQLVRLQAMAVANDAPEAYQALSVAETEFSALIEKALDTNAFGRD